MCLSSCMCLKPQRCWLAYKVKNRSVYACTREAGALLYSGSPGFVANDDHSWPDGRLLTRFDTFRHTPSINIILTLHLGARARACARVRAHTDVWEHSSMSVYAACMCICVPGRLWMIDSGVIYYSTVTSISKSAASVHPWGDSLSLSLPRHPLFCLSLSLFLSPGAVRKGYSHSDYISLDKLCRTFNTTSCYVTVCM